MVDIHYERNEGKIKISPDPEKVAGELATAINRIYSGFAFQSPVMAKAFKAALMICLKDGSPVWEREKNMTMIAVPVLKENQHGDS